MKPTYKNLANFYGLTYQTVSNWSKTKPNIYKALVMYFEDNNKEMR